MSELTQCNYCSLQGIKRRAGREGKHVHLNPDTRMSRGGVDIYVTPVTVDLPTAGVTQGSEFHQQYWVGWFMGVTKSCVC